MGRGDTTGSARAEMGFFARNKRAGGGVQRGTWQRASQRDPADCGGRIRR
jgi:hypothetical protein